MREKGLFLLIMNVLTFGGGHIELERERNRLEILNRVDNCLCSRKGNR